MIPGLYNAYNAVAATAVARTLGVPRQTIADALRGYRSAFGRIERVTYRGRSLTLALVKNPVGFNETLRMLTVATGGLTVPTLIAINDLAADGRDVSWLWDVDFEMLCRRVRAALHDRHPRRGHGEPAQIRGVASGTRSCPCRRTSPAVSTRSSTASPKARRGTSC